jgi:hypothetical protein
VPVEVAPVAASKADTPDEVTNELSAAQSPLNSRRFSNLISLLFTIRSFHCAQILRSKVVQTVVLLNSRPKIEG